MNTSEGNGSFFGPSLAVLLGLLPFEVGMPAGSPGLWAQEVGSGVVVRGSVVDHDSGEPLGGAAVSLRPGSAGTGGRGTRVTNEMGEFLFHEVPWGTYRLSVTRLGYHSMEEVIQVPSERGLELLLPLSTEPIPLDPILVEVERERYAPGYHGRDRAGAGPYLLTREEIERRHPLRVTDILASVPGVRVLTRPYLQSVVLLRGDCIPTLVLDGVRLPHVEGIDRLVSPGDVESIRVYHGAELPVQYGLNHCGGVVIETRTGEPQEEEGALAFGFWSKLLVVGLLVFGVVLAG